MLDDRPGLGEHDVSLVDHGSPTEHVRLPHLVWTEEVGTTVKDRELVRKPELLQQPEDASRAGAV